MNVINILLVEDDELDTMHIKRAFEKLKIIYKLNVAKNGEEAIELLRNDKTNSSQRLPDVILIDINMPRMNGFEFLSVIRSSQEWKDLKCFIITTSEEEVDKKEAERLGVSGYIVKPLKLNNPSSMDVFNLIIDLINIKE